MLVSIVLNDKTLFYINWAFVKKHSLKISVKNQKTAVIRY
ncbi:hypothetical protein PFLA_a1239 [Pseudoalteromonas flavipulchra NCIMB 2033 = ATCC BAA-314]|nr:hypothetical protein [Pseudoalteromonas flavipulchra NCIMB 2033 = ATCC BAA-314]